MALHPAVARLMRWSILMPQRIGPFYVNRSGAAHRYWKIQLMRYPYAVARFNKESTTYAFDEAVDSLRILCQRWSNSFLPPDPMWEPFAEEVVRSENLRPPERFRLFELFPWPINDRAIRASGAGRPSIISIGDNGGEKEETDREAA